MSAHGSSRYRVSRKALRREYVDWRGWILWLLRAYAHSELRGRSRLISFLHPKLVPPDKPRSVRIYVGPVPFEVDLTRRREIELYYGWFEPNEVAFLRRLLKPGDIFVDAGANVGIYSAIAASLVGPEGEVHAFEPTPDNFERLNCWADLVRGCGSSVYTRRQALGDGYRQLTGRTHTGSLGWSLLYPVMTEALGQQRTYSEFTVDVVRLDGYLEECTKGRVDVIKIDVEGSELLVLRGLEKLFNKGTRPVILCECKEPTAAEVFALLTSYGYRSFRCMEGGRLAPLALSEATNCHLVAFMPRGTAIV